MNDSKNSQVTTLEDNKSPSKGDTKPDAKSAAAAVKAAELKGQGNGDFTGKKVMLTIAASPGDGGKDAVFVSVAGVAFQIPRGKPWVVPVEVVNALENAVETHYDRDPQTGVVQAIDSPRYTFVSQPVAAQA